MSELSSSQEEVIGESFLVREPKTEAASAVAPTDRATLVGSASVAATTTTTPSTMASILFLVVVPLNQQEAAA